MDSSTLHRCTRSAALIYACYSSFVTWRPPTSLTGAGDEDSRSAERAAVGVKTEDDKSEDNGKGRGKPGHKHSKRRGRSLESRLCSRAFRLLYATGMTAMVLSDLFIFDFWGGGWTGFINARWTLGDLIALAVMHLGVSVRKASYVALGEFFTFKVTTSDNHKLVDTGPYSLLMHPGYTGLILQRIALTYFLGLQHSPWVFAAYTAFGIPPMASRIRNEEAELEEHFGRRDFQAYKQTRWRLIPFVL